jgi:hypothetical protein
MLSDASHVCDIAAQNGNIGTKQFSSIPGPSYVSSMVPGRGYRPDNAFPLTNPGNAIPNIGPIKGLGAQGQELFATSVYVCQSMSYAVCTTPSDV